MRPSRLVPAVVGMVALASPPGAAAHLRSGTVAVSLRARVSRLGPSVDAALSAHVLTSDRALVLTVRADHSVVVLGYLGEPFLRVDRRGVAVARHSPTAVAAGLVSGPGRTGWQLRPGRNSVTWHDARVQGLPAGAARAGWSVPLVVDGRRARLHGTIVRLSRPSPWPWVAVAGLVVAATLGLARRPARARHGAVVLALLAAGAASVVAAVFAVDGYASPGTWIESIDELVFLSVGVVVLVRGGGQSRLVASVGLGLVAVAVGATKGAVFLDGAVLAVVPAAVARLLVALAVTTGAAAATVGVACLAGRRGAALPPGALRLPT